ncbi:N-acetyl-D-Glu racemase DgcA [Actibacterium sp. 188UL27-1]|uniref:N-acetyl-D-Glu racemase DgcA n=1 Tax=Actibacterium sp. 188UL27-1 TaxID=2786961 RepID=UPI00195BC03F|nr:N-acetyl-D-Glu racemase DgcA [Actibacterium sp. 188UL27-1]MBM7067938.1 dipeptide epimerase [Actibacterium sp. 188UL27-1]
MELTVTSDSFKLAQVFTIARGSRTEAKVLTVRIRDGDHMGQGECVPYARYGESLESVTAQIEGLEPPFDRIALQEMLPPGAARNAVDCALWDLEAKRAGKPAWALAGLAEPGPVTTVYSLSLESPEQMKAAAAAQAYRPMLKIKLGTPDDLARLEAVRAGAPKPPIVVDANEGWTAEVYSDLVPHLQRLGVTMVEQPLPAAEDEALREIARPVPVCADESFHDRASLAKVAGKYDMVNIKLDKTGGLTEALAVKEAALAEGYTLMMGCMVGSSLAMAPGMLPAQGMAVVDLDAPLLLAEDRATPLRYDGSIVYPPEPALWG